ncbi:MFS transporter [Peribacillus sp. FSL E2-0218]|uniref:MFS transporter n=1 Tax=Peribacillus sp. FSL E2-0218 TaxID=2921364 RepID=UPI0030EBA2FF
MKILNRDNFSFAGMQSFYWAGFCILFAYLTPYMYSLGYSNTQVGVLAASISVASIIGQPVCGYMCDRLRTVKHVMVFCLALSAVLTVLFLFVGKSFGMLLILSTIISFIFQALYPLIDSWTVTARLKNSTINYGLTRGIGSLGYAFTAAVAGIIFDHYGYKWMFYLFILTACITILCALFPQDIKPTSKDDDEQGQLKMKDLKQLLLNKEYFGFVLIMTILYIAYKANSTFLPALMTKVGGTNADLGLAWSILGLSEVPFILISGLLLKKYKDTSIIFIAMIFFILRVGLPIFATNPTQLIWMTALQGLSYGLFLPASVYYISRIVPKHLTNSAQTFAVALYSGLGIAIAGILGGWIADSFGIYSVYKIGGIVVIIMTVTYRIMLNLLKKKGELHEVRPTNVGLGDADLKQHL